MTISLYRTPSPLSYYVVEGDYALAQLPADAQQIYSSPSSSREEALTEIDRLIGRPAYLDVQRAFQAALDAGLPPAGAVRKVHCQIGEVSAGVWPDHFQQVLGADPSAIASLFVAWWPSGVADITDEDFNARVRALSDAASQVSHLK
jgi:hypothetical protein